MGVSKITGKRKTVYGIGINDAPYLLQSIVDGKQVMCPFYKSWARMLERCYSEKRLLKFPTYQSCSVCEEWLTFSNFKAWMEKQDWGGMNLDKDVLISGNKQYSPYSCIFITTSVNSLLTDSAVKRGIYPLGVCWHKATSKFIANARVNGKQKHLGLFATAQLAHKAWQAAKKQVIYDVALEQTDGRLRTALLSRCTHLQYDIDNGLETFKL